MIETKQLDLAFATLPQMTKFLDECDTRGFMNNNTLAAMKYDWCIDEGGAWFGTFDNNRLVSLSGIHPFKDGYRVLLRGAQLESNHIGLNKYHMQSYCFHSQLPLQIEFADDYPVYITTNTLHDASGKMGRINKTFELLEKVGLVSYVSTEEIYYVEQNIWKLNKDRYLEVRANF